MGSLFSSILSSLSSLFGGKECRILILGLDNAGKTTILYRLHVDDAIQTIPTIGFNVETIQYKNVKLQVWDLGGQSSIRPYWRYYYHNTNAVVFVVDSADWDRIPDSRQELQALLEEDELKGVTLVVFANKQDLPGVMTPADISEKLGLSSIKNRQWAIFQTSALKGTGISEGLDWLTNVLSTQ